MAPLTASKPNRGNLTATRQAPGVVSHSPNSNANASKYDKAQLVLIWKGGQYTFNRLLQRYEHSPMIAQTLLAELLQAISLLPDMKLNKEDSPEKMGDAPPAVQQAFQEIKVLTPPERYQVQAVKQLESLRDNVSG